MVAMNSDDFRQAVEAAVAGMPVEIRRQVHNVAIVVEDWPDEETLELAGVDDRTELLGFYYGIPLTQRTSHYGMVLPDKISLFREPIQLVCATDAEVVEAIRHTLYHELAHYFGISDERLDEMGAY
jgi:predicted Zn-dependent protease with MMP-like domain